MVVLNYDVIGDIHGHADKLEQLLGRLGYSAKGRSFRAPQGRQAVFLGDLIDRGPQQLRVLEIVREMVEAGDALCIMGNHEFNAVAYVTPDPLNPGDFYRPNRGNTPKAEKNRNQHAEFLRQVGEGSAQHVAWVKWFRTLPVCLDLGGIRVVHACWDQPSVDALWNAGWKPGALLDDRLMAILHEHNADGSESSLMQARKLLTCGLEIPLPNGKAIQKDGHRFDSLRIANWRAAAQKLSDVALLPKGQEHLIHDMEWPLGLVMSSIEGSPVFLGHHWFSGHPTIESPKLACLDWSAGKGGPLVAYRWDGEDSLSDAKLVWAGAIQ